MRIASLQTLMFATIVAFGGCEDRAEDRVAVAGKVFIDGRPLAGGTIRFVPESGRPASSAIRPDGSFEISSESVNRVSEPGLPRGKYRVQVSASEIVDDETIRWNVPEKYADFRTSGLAVTVNKPIDDAVIELTWDGDQPQNESDRSTKTADFSEADAGQVSAPAGGPASSQNKDSQ